MAADVMMGHDPDCARWIRRFRESAAAGRRRRSPAAAAAKAAADRGRLSACMTTRRRSSSSRPPASAAASRSARRCCRRRARSASTSIPSAAGAGSAAAARCWSPKASSPSTASVPARRAFRRSASRARYASRQGLGAGRRLSCSTLVQGDVVVDVPSNSQVHRQVVRKDADAHDIELESRRPAALRRGAGAGHARSVRRPAPADGCARTANGSSPASPAISRCSSNLQPALRKGQWKVTVAVHGDKQIIAVWPGLPRQGLRHRGRRRLDDDRRASLRSGERRRSSRRPAS